jgi:hypothetical protein
MNDPKEKKSEANPKSAAPAQDDSSSIPPKKDLTPEEQMALYEENLKETDWGHQPC